MGKELELVQEVEHDSNSQGITLLPVPGKVYFMGGFGIRKSDVDSFLDIDLKKAHGNL